MRIIGILLKKDFKERTSNLKNVKKDIAGSILNVFLSLFIIGVFVFSFSYFTKTYSSIKIGYITNKTDRVFEILTIFYAILFILLVLVGTVRLNKNLINVGNLTLLSMPITPFQIFVSEIVGVYFELVLTSIAISVPVFLLLVIQSLAPWFTIFISILFSFLIPAIALGFASLLTIPFYFLKNWLNKHVVIQLFVYILLMVGVFLVYSLFLRFVKGLIESGQISYFFNENTVLSIGKICKALYPANIFSSLIVGKNVLLNILFLFLSVAGGCFVSLFMAKSIFSLVRQNKIGAKSDLYVKKDPREQKNKTTSLMAKEFLNVLRTPSLAFNYFAIVLSLPLMVVITSNIVCSMMKELTLLNCDFEIVLCAISMFSIVLNSFCANNISRDGKFFNLLKTFPLSPKKIVFSKILFCIITSFISIVLSGVSILIYGILSPLKVIAVIVICCVLNVGVICLATRKDLNTTKNKHGEENKNSVNFLIFWGLLLSITLTVVSFVLSLYLQTKYNLLVSNLISSAILFGISCAILIISLVYLLKNLDKKFKEIVL